MVEWGEGGIKVCMQSKAECVRCVEYETGEEREKNNLSSRYYSLCWHSKFHFSYLA